MRGFLIAVVLACVLVGGVFSLRPGGLRVQLRLMKRRAKILFILAGIFIVVSFVIRVAAPNVTISDIGVIALGLAIAIAFLIWAQDPPLETQRPTQQSRPPRR
ncbi:MAG: hypothetical protein J2P38_09855 [Candidatus Dormibacteraeota bacterium]|nr:hypothetical protein [Candidatus Dormibacteraeota bacterium]